MFTRLFDRRVENHAAICTGINRIARHVAMGFGFSQDDLDDASQEATLNAMRQIGKFNVGAGTTAFAYFTSVVVNALKKYRQKLERTRCRSLDGYRDTDRWVHHEQ